MRVVIMRGLPGSGKSTKAKTYGGLIVSADHYFEKTGTYVFNPAFLGEAHEECKAKFLQALAVKTPVVVVDNTNTMKWEYDFYAKEARKRGYEVVVDSLFDGGLTDEELTARNTHGCPLHSIRVMRGRWEV